MQASNQKLIKHLLYLYWDYATNIYLFKANNRSLRKRCEVCSKLTIETVHFWSNFYVTITSLFESNSSVFVKPKGKHLRWCLLTTTYAWRAPIKKPQTIAVVFLGILQVFSKAICYRTTPDDCVCQVTKRFNYFDQDENLSWELLQTSCSLKMLRLLSHNLVSMNY